ncbi:hypothetical protein BT67DRAFT_445188 [Trichocladium antarcticum]|uniref:AT hook domain-containing protein n=1 Tax=Trichocladium antarcticum TaxID=1450529 RepID=A0AAN6UE08_9PEZI|nr:hypothetical protein BT67DRAFT_445188 [Trichocladium antarcticum]
MASPREILDSEDDGSDFGDNPEVSDADAHRRIEVPHHEPATVDASHDASTGSTDPSFFQRIYDEQQAAAGARETIIPDTAPAGASVWTCTEVSSAPTPGQKPQAADFSSLTPITDPVPASRRSNRTRRVPQADLIDLTDITTPGKEAAADADDVWDVPSSARSQRATRTYGKRQRAGQQLSLQQEATSDMAPTQDPYDFPESTPRTRKKTKRNAPSSSAQHAQDSSPVLQVPTEETTSSGRRRTTRSMGNNSALSGDPNMADTSTALYITQSSLTASQKQEYHTINPSSEAGLDMPETPLPRPPPGVGEVYKSSGATTIAYPTPSRIRSSRKRAPAFDGLEGNDAAEVLADHDVDHQARYFAALGEDAPTVLQPSSPDVLHDMSAENATKAKRSGIKAVSSGGLGSADMDPPVPTTRRKRRRKMDQEEDPLLLDAVDGAQGNDNSLQQDGKAEDELKDATVSGLQPDPNASDQPVAPPEVEAIDVDPIESPAAAPPAPTQRKKPARKKKGSKTKAATPPAEPEPAPATEPAEAAEPPATRKRGRPRKPEAAAARSVEPAADAEAANTAPSPQPLSEFSRGHKSQPHPGAEEGDNNDDDDTKRNGLPPPHAVAEPVGKETEKTARNQTDQKVQYRVGLSKRSRIAPLLKFVKKPT